MMRRTLDAPELDAPAPPRLPRLVVAWPALVALVALVVAGGCEGPPGPRPLAVEAHPIPTEGLRPPSVTDPGGPPSRARRRMDLDQLDAAFQRVLGTAWVENNQNQLTALAATLGKPDFVERTDEDLTISPLFQKFLDDAARKLCADLLAAERSRPAPARIFFTAVDVDADSRGPELDAELAYLLLRFHGQPADGGALDVWRHLFVNVAAAAGPSQAWNAVCVALITHPDFVTY